MEGGNEEWSDYFHEAKGIPLGDSSSSPTILNTSEEALASWHRDWDDYVTENGMANIRAMLQRSPCEFPGGAYKYAWVLLSWLEFYNDHLLPDALPSRRQRMRANSHAKKHAQVGGGEGKTQQPETKPHALPSPAAPK